MHAGHPQDCSLCHTVHAALSDTALSVFPACACAASVIAHAQGCSALLDQSMQQATHGFHPVVISCTLSCSLAAALSACMAITQLHVQSFSAPVHQPSQPVPVLLMSLHMSRVAGRCMIRACSTACRVLGLLLSPVCSAAATPSLFAPA